MAKTKRGGAAPKTVRRAKPPATASSMRPHEGHGSTPPRKKPQRGHPSEAKTYQIAGHTVEIRMGDDHEELRIESVRTKFFRTEDGYNLHAAAYEPPYESLQEAVKAFLTRRKATGKSR